MSKKIKSIIIAAILLVVLVGVVVVLDILKKQDEKNPASTPSYDSNLVTLVEENRGNAEWLKIKNSKGEYEIKPIGENVYSAVGLEDLPQANYVYIETLAAVCNVVATEVVEEGVTDFSKYGLSSPEVEFTLKMKDKEPYHVQLGALSPDKGLRYGKMGSSDTVYAFSANSFPTLFFGKFDYLSGELLPQFNPEDPNDVPVFEKIVVTRPDLEVPLVFEKMGDEYFTENAVMQATVMMTSPVKALLSETPAQEYFYSNFGIGAEEIAAINPDEAQLEEFGFNEPTSVFDVTYSGGKNIKITTGKGVECKHQLGEDLTGHKHQVLYHYTMREGSGLVYLMKTDLMRWFKMQPKDVISIYAIIPSVYDLDSVELTSNGKTYEIKYATKTEDGVKSVVGGTVNGKEVDADGARTFLQLLGSTSVNDINTKPVTDKPSTTIKYKYKDGKTDVVDLIITKDRECIISLNGSNALKGRAALVNKIEQELQKLIKGEKVDLSW